MLDFVRNSLRLSQQTTSAANSSNTSARNSGGATQCAAPGESAVRRSTAVFFDPKGRSSVSDIPAGNSRRTADGRVSIARNLYAPDVEAARVRDSCAIDEEALNVEAALQQVCQQRFGGNSHGAIDTDSICGSGDAALFSKSDSNTSTTGPSAMAQAATGKFQPNLFARGRNTEALLLLKEHLMESMITQKNNKTENANLALEVERIQAKNQDLAVQKENFEYSITGDEQHIASLQAERTKELQKFRNNMYQVKQLQLEKTRDQERLRIDIKRQKMENQKLEKMLGAQYMQSNNLILS